MSLVTAHGLGKYFGAQDVFSDVELSIARDDKIALVGPNGAGKTTLLRILMGLEEPSAGQVHRSRDVQFGYLPQHAEFASQQTLHGEMLGVFEGLRSQQHDLQTLADAMAAESDDADLLARYAEAEHRFDAAGGYTYEQRIERVLSGLGFRCESYPVPVSVLSGGQVTRALLAKLLLQEPTLLILDEPTNYLDLRALEWLEDYLQSWPHALLVVSHDRYFMDKVVSRVWELSHGALKSYRGNYSAYLVQREAQIKRQTIEFEQQQQVIAETEEFIRRYKTGQRSKEARGRETRLNRLERVELPPQERAMQVRLSTPLRSGDKVLMSDGAQIGYVSSLAGEPSAAQEHVLLETGEFLVQRGQCVALLGPNGSGKTTFLRAILGESATLSGRIRVGASVRLGYLPQNQQWLDERKTVLEHVLDASRLQIDEARHLLGRFLFSGDEVFKQVSCLSGGERSRLALALLTLRGANVLLLDEPTTHLDVESQEVLQQVLQRFEGTILFVSHDRYLVDALATHVWVIEEGRLRQHEGNYSEYVLAAQQERQATGREASRRTVGAEYEERRRQERQIQRHARRRVERVQSLESEIDRLEEQVRHIASLIDLASSSHDMARVHALGLEYQQVQAALAGRLVEWEGCVDEPDEAEPSDDDPRRGERAARERPGRERAPSLQAQSG